MNGKVIVHHHQGHMTSELTTPKEFEYLFTCGVLKPSDMMQLLLGKTVVIRYSTMKNYTVEVEKNGLSEPPVGLAPKWLRDEQKAKEIGKAINRYINAGMNIPEEWWAELNPLLDTMREKRKRDCKEMLNKLKETE